MGCCFSDENSETYQDQDVNETTRLLSDPVSDGPSRHVPTYTNTPGTTTSHQKGDEQSALNRILHNTANNVIDVGALDAQAMEQHEYMDRARQYSVRLSQAVGSMHSVRAACTRQLPVGVAAPHAVLSQPPVSPSDINLITNTNQNVAKTVKDIKVKHKEDLVVPFGVPQNV